MERLALCSKILYDRDILEKQKEIIELKNKLNKIETPQVLFDNWYDYENEKEVFHYCLEERIKKYFNDFDYISEMKFLSYEQTREIATAIILCLLNYTKCENFEWAEYVAWNIVTGVEGFINGILKVKSIIECFTPEDFGVIIF